MRDYEYQFDLEGPSVCEHDYHSLALIHRLGSVCIKCGKMSVPTKSRFTGYGGGFIVYEDRFYFEDGRV